MDLTAFYSLFRDETIENIRVLTSGLIALESADIAPEDRRSQIDAIFRAMHTIKGSARLLGQEDIGRIAHTCEHILGAVREGRRELDRPLADELLRGGDVILELVTAMVEGRQVTVDVEALTRTLGRGLRQDSPEDAPPALEPPPALPMPAAPANIPQNEPPALAVPKQGRVAVRQTIRVRVDRLDRLLNLAGELAVGHQTQAAHLQVLEEVRSLIVQQQRTLLLLESELARLRFSSVQRELFDRHINSILNAGDDASKLIKTQVDHFGQHVTQTAQLVEDLEQEVMAARLLPVSTLFTNLPRAVRELARDSGKEVALVVSGEETELDRKVIEALNDPLLHLIRNAVDHGIQPPDERERAGKPRQGTITVGAQSFGTYAHITVADDGRGMDPQRLRQSAIQKGLLTADSAARLSDTEALELIFVPGFSTAQMITDISGRGVGMDVVRTNLAEIGGHVLIESHPGLGTTITLALPLTLVTTRVLLVEVAGQTFGLPASGCHGTLWTSPDQLPTIEGRVMLTHEGQLTPLLGLADLLELEAPRFNLRQRVPTVLIGAAQRRLALLVDRMLDEREVVVKPLGPLMERQRRFSGAIQLGDGQLVLLLNPAILSQIGRGMIMTPRARRDTVQRRSHLLVADDSFATRELIRSILQSAGYDVTTATDGLDALDKLRDDVYDLVVSDVEMPRVDGFTLTNRIRKELGRTDLPVIIVTSLASETHRRRGLEVGAQAYIVKSQFNQGNLLETIRQLLGI